MLTQRRNIELEERSRRLFFLRRWDVKRKEMAEEEKQRHAEIRRTEARKGWEVVMKLHNAVEQMYAQIARHQPAEGS